MLTLYEFHESFTAFDGLSGFSNVVRSAVNLWSTSLTTPLQNVGGKTHFQRIFPSGMMFLITEDFMVKEKRATVSILSWFKEKLEGNRARMLVLRPRVISWLIQRAEEPNGETDTDL
jgi:chromo domain-containing protein 1